ncbi:MAG: carboxypeptidase regulatory-like domain-containing protein [Acidimicrobiia bacterium]|nr:carboxypeptidase regulatory-like domain-containing protein [Acidimicrobiia bacterium]
MTEIGQATARRSTRWRRRPLVLVVALMLATALVAAPGNGVAAADTSQRYIDEVFADVTVTSDVLYGQAVNHGALVDLRLDVYEPTGDVATERPLFVWIHGGSFTGGDKAGALDVAVATRMARQGYVAVSVGYRLGTSTNFEAIMNAYTDASDAVAWLRANAEQWRIDTSRVVASGASAGGITALNLAYMPNRAAGEGLPDDPRHVSAAVSLAGSTVPNIIEAGEPPSYLAHGTADTVVPFSSAVNTCAAADAVGVECVLDVYEGATHGSLFLFGNDILDDASVWLYDRLALEAMTSLSGRVTTDGGDPVAGVVVRAVPPGQPGLLRSTVTDEEGRYRIDGLTPGPQAVQFDTGSWFACLGATGSCGRGQYTEVIVAGADEVADVDAVVGGGTAGGLAGTVIDDLGAPVVDVAVWAIGAGFSSVHVASTSAEGTYTLSGLPEGSYAVAVLHDDGWACHGPGGCGAALFLPVGDTTTAGVDVVVPAAP